MDTSAINDSLSEFEACTSSKDIDSSRVEISCKKGFWSVTGNKGKYRTFSEAFSYFVQYKQDGEYHDIIGGPSPIEILRDRQ